MSSSLAHRLQQMGVRGEIESFELSETGQIHRLQQFLSCYIPDPNRSVMIIYSLLYTENKVD